MYDLIKKFMTIGLSSAGHCKETVVFLINLIRIISLCTVLENVTKVDCVKIINQRQPRQ